MDKRKREKKEEKEKNREEEEKKRGELTPVTGARRSWFQAVKHLHGVTGGKTVSPTSLEFKRSPIRIQIRRDQLNDF